jgi:hypothetical protein
LADNRLVRYHGPAACVVRTRGPASGLTAFVFFRRRRSDLAENLEKVTMKLRAANFLAGEAGIQRTRGSSDNK